MTQVQFPVSFMVALSFKILSALFVVIATRGANGLSFNLHCTEVSLGGGVKLQVTTK